MAFMRFSKCMKGNENRKSCFLDLGPDLALDSSFAKWRVGLIEISLEFVSTTDRNLRSTGTVRVTGLRGYRASSSHDQ